MKRIVPTIIITAALVVVGIGIYKPWIGDVVETWEDENGKIKIRVENRAENLAWLPGAYYVFLSSSSGSDDWREIMTFRHDDPGTIPRENARFVNEQVAHVFMGWMFAVTTDGGVSWSVWNAKRDWHEACANYGLIQNVNIASDGAGVMTLSPNSSCGKEMAKLQTRDYGKHWIP